MLTALIGKKKYGGCYTNPLKDIFSIKVYYLHYPAVFLQIGPQLPSRRAFHEISGGNKGDDAFINSGL
ncbi:hypothetical protein SDC9_191067 [bioreactor metagenome]|uniref:Uncharacterized protein n=1 Tax=bioreactor metagenome TaxID=1076179 RepID=A0A645HWX5_9ZZZZ